MKAKNNKTIFKKNIKDSKIVTKSLIIFFIIILSILLYNVIFSERNHQPQIITGKDNMLEKINDLYKQNNDLVGWLKINDTNIDYPVMYIKGEDYYLHRDFYKKYYSAGTLFVDKYNEVNPRDTNLIIYGHNMSNGTMFHDLLKYKSEEFYNNHKNIIFYNLEEKQVYEIVAVFLSKIYNVDDTNFKFYKFYNASNESEYFDFIKNIQKLSLYDTNVTPCFNDELITLSTCEYSTENGRFVVVARKISHK